MHYKRHLKKDKEEGKDVEIKFPDIEEKPKKKKNIKLEDFAILRCYEYEFLAPIRIIATKNVKQNSNSNVASILQTNDNSPSNANMKKNKILQEKKKSSLSIKIIRGNENQNFESNGLFPKNENCNNLQYILAENGESFFVDTPDGLYFNKDCVNTTNVNMYEEDYNKTYEINFDFNEYII